MAVKPKLALIPSGVKANKVYSVLPADGVGDFDFSRSGSATRVNKDGLIETVDSNVPRLNYPLIDGVVSGCPSLLLEPASTNLVTYSEDFSNAVWFPTPSLVTVTSNQFISPDGALNADRLQIQSTSSLAILSYLVSHTIGVKISVSAWVKSNTNSIQKIKLFGDYGTSNAVSSEFIVEDYWKRIEFTFTPTATGNRNVGFYNVSNLATDIQIFGFQSEVNSFATSYIPTNGSTVTRDAETCNGAGDANTFNDSEGVLFAEISALANDGTTRRWSISDGSYSNRITLELDEASNTLKAFVILTDAEPSYSPSEVLSDITNYNKVAIKYKQNDFALWINGFEFDVDNSGDTPINLSKMQFADGNGTDAPFYGNTKQIQYFDSALNDTDLETLTSWTSFNEMATGQLYSIQ